MRFTLLCILFLFVAPAQTAERSWNLFIGKNLNPDAELNEVSYSGVAGYSEDYDVELGDLGISLGAEYYHQTLKELGKENDLKFYVVSGVSHELERGADNISWSGSDGSSGSLSSAETGKYSLAITSIYSNLEVHFTNNFLAFLGGSYTIPTFESPDIEVENSFGYQLGAGYNFNERFNIKLTYRPLIFGLDGSVSGAGSVSGDLEYDQALVTFGYKL